MRHLFWPFPSGTDVSPLTAALVTSVEDSACPLMYLQRHFHAINGHCLITHITHLLYGSFANAPPCHQCYCGTRLSPSGWVLQRAAKVFHERHKLEPLPRGELKVLHLPPASRLLHLFLQLCCLWNKNTKYPSQVWSRS